LKLSDLNPGDVQLASSQAPSLKLSDLSPNDVQPATKADAPGYGESLARGAAQGGTLGFADELAGAGGAIVDAGASLGNNSVADIVKSYIQHRDQYRQADAAAKAANPKTFTGGMLGGGLATAFVPGLNIAKAATIGGRIAGAAGLGAAAALGNSNADLTTGKTKDYVQAGIDTGIGGATGAVLQPAIEKVIAPAVGYTAGKIGDLAGWAGKKALNVAFDTPEKLTENYLRNPKAYNNALPPEGVAQKLADTLGDVRNDTGPASEAAMSTLSTERAPNEGFKVSDAVNSLRRFNDPSTQKLADRLEQEYAARAPGLGAEARPTTITRKMDFIKQEPAPTDYEAGLKQTGETPTNFGYESEPNIGYTTPEENPTQWLKGMSNNRIEGVPETPPEANYLTEREMHDVKKAFQDAAGNWKSPLPTSEMSSARIASGDINQMLKGQNNDYQSAMSDLSQNIQSKQGLAQKFALQPDYSGANESGFTFSDRTLSALKDIVRGNKVDRARVLQGLKDQGYGDLADDVEKSLGRSYFEGSGATNGGRRVYAGMAAGAGIGHTVGSMTGVPSAGTVGAAIGGAMGGQLGATVDKYGPQIAKKALDATVITQSLSQTPGAQQFIGAIKSAAAQGQGALATTHFILSQTEPAYQKAVNGGE